MPASRNANLRRASENSTSDGSAWKSPDRAAVHNHDVKAEEPLLCTPSSPLQPLTPSSSCSPPPVTIGPSTFRDGRRRRRGDPHRVTRPRNAFIIFRSSYIKSYGSNNSKEEEDDDDTPDRADRHPPNQNEISRIAAKVWNIMSDEEKKPFCREAYAERAEHRRLHPNFVYAANGSGGVRRRGKGKGKGKGTESPTPIASPEVTFVPLSEIPPLELPPPVTSDSDKTYPAYPLFAPDIPNFFPHIDRSPNLKDELYGCPHGALCGATLGDTQPNSAYTFPAELPRAHSSFMDDPYRYADYPPSPSSDVRNNSLGFPVEAHFLTDDPSDSFFDFSAFDASADFRGL